MAKVCAVCGKKPSFGNSRSHSMVATKRRFDPNLQRVRVVLGAADPRVRFCTRCYLPLTSEPFSSFKVLLNVNGAGKPDPVTRVVRTACERPRRRARARAALDSLERNRRRIDDLNVYPVPDGDTGTNMTLTVEREAAERDADQRRSAPGIAASSRGGAARRLRQLGRDPLCDRARRHGCPRRGARSTRRRSPGRSARRATLRTRRSATRSRGRS